MANLIRSAKSGCDWTVNDLDSYNISLNQVDPLLFFGLQALPQSLVDQELLSIVDAGAMQQDRHAELITLLDLAMIPRKGHAKTDVCIVDRSQNVILLLVQEDRRLEHWEPVNARAQLVSEAVAAFNENNVQREAAGLPPMAEKVIPGIVMVGTSPAFFKIPVSQTLSTNIRYGTYSPEETRVTYCYPPVPRPAHRRSEGMKPLDNRREILKCYEAFKAIVGI